MCASPRGPSRSTRCASPPAARDLLLGCDLVVSASAEALSRLRPGHSRAIVNSHETITGDFTRNPDLPFPGGRLRRSIAAAVGAGRRRVRRGDAPGDRPARRFDRHQSVHARLRLSARAGAGLGRGDRARHRAQRRRGRFQPRRLSTGAGAPRSTARRSKRAPCRRTRVPESHRLSEIARRTGRAPRRVPDRATRTPPMPSAMSTGSRASARPRPRASAAARR